VRFLEERLEKRTSQGLLRSLVPQTALLDFTSNDYLGLAREETLLSVASSGSTGSRLLTGHSRLYDQLEGEIAAFHRAQSCLIYTSGYMANLGLLSALGTEEVTFLYDLEIHASMIDGMSLSSAKKVPFRHNDLNSLEQRLKRSTGQIFVLIESLYSISGDLAPLEEIVRLCAYYGAALIVDEAHATGLFGLKGEGLVVALNLEKEVFARVHTFSKALGSHGACIVGSALLKNYLINFSRQQIYTTALPPSTLLQIQNRYKRLQGAPRHALFENIAYLQSCLALEQRKSPIQPIYIAGAERVRLFSKQLQEAGFETEDKFMTLHV